MSQLGKELHLRDYLRVIYKQRKVVGGFFLATMLAVVIVTFGATPEYEGRTKVIIEKEEPSSLTDRTRGYARDPEFYETQFQLIKSRAIADKIVEKLSLEESYETYLGPPGLTSQLLLPLKTAWSRLREVGGKLLGRTSQEPISVEANLSRADLIAMQIARGLKVQPEGASRIVAVSYFAPNPEFAALVANTAVEAYVEETMDMKMESTRRTLEWMTRKADGERGNLERAERVLQAYMDANDIVTLENRVAVTPERLSELSTQLVRAESRRKELESLYAQVNAVVDDAGAAETVRAIAADPTLQMLRAQVVEAEKAIMELSGKYGQKHPLMNKVQGDLRILQQKKAQEIDRIVRSIRNEYELARAAEIHLQAQLDQTKGEAQRLSEKFIQYGSLKREVETNRTLFDALLLKLKEQSITEANQSVNLWVIEAAAVPTVPSRPLRGFNLLLGMVLGLFGGIGLAFFVEYFDNTIKNPEEAEAALETPVLGVVARCPEGQEVEEVVAKDPRSAFAEGYRALRTSLLLSAADAPPKKILITSSLSGEGKTTTVANLALALAQSELRVLLIDADLRRPRLHKIFKLENKKGLSSYLAGASTGEIMVQGPLPNLTIISSGPIPPNPSELLSSSRMKTLLDTLGEEFEVILCDSAPLLAVADTRALSRVCDGTVLVARGRETTYETAARALKQLHDLNARVSGLLINDLDLQEEGYYYEQYYGQGEQAPRVSRMGNRLRKLAGVR